MSILESITPDYEKLFQPFDHDISIISQDENNSISTESLVTIVEYNDQKENNCSNVSDKILFTLDSKNNLVKEIKKVDQPKSKNIVSFRELLRKIAEQVKENKTSIKIDSINPNIYLTSGRYITGWETIVRNDTYFFASISHYLDGHNKEINIIPMKGEKNFSWTGLISLITNDNCKRILLIQDSEGYFFHVPISIYSDVTITEEFIIANLLNWCGLSLIMAPTFKFDKNYDYLCSMSDKSEFLFTKFEM